MEAGGQDGSGCKVEAGLDEKRWIVLVPKVGGKEGQMEEWDLVEEFFHRIQNPLDDGEDDDDEDDDNDGEERTVGRR